MPKLITLLLAAALSAPAQSGVDVRPALDLDDLRTFADVFGYIKQHYVDDVDDRTLLDAAIRGMLSELDPHSAWLSPDELAGLEESASGRYGGLGVEIQVHESFLEVITAMENTPAARAGIRTGDRIIAIDALRLDSRNAAEATRWLRGAPGTRVELTVERDDQEDPLEFMVTRELIRVPNITARMLEPDLGYLRISSFSHNAGAALDEAFANLSAQNALLNGLVIDLRGNPGGVLGASVAVADRFLNGGLVVYTDGRSEHGRLEFSATAGDMTGGLPLVVLVDRGSASAAEIVAGALQAHGRALILGERTFGKGSVQTVWPLRNGTGMRLTTARYYTPNGRSIQAEGIEPDVTATGNGVVDSNDTRRREADLDRHLPGDRPADEPARPAPADYEDLVLAEAVKLLRSAQLLTRKLPVD